MSRQVVLRMQPGESIDDFTTRVANAAPPLTPHLAHRLRTLLAIAPPTAPAPAAPLRDRVAA